MIQPNADLSITRQARLLGVSRSSVYYHPKPDSTEELDLLKRLDELFTENPVYGSRRMQAVLKREGVQVGRRRIRRLMRKLGLWAITPKPDTSRPHPEHKIYPYLLRGMAIDQPNQVWAKKGDKSAGVARQWNGRLGKTDNSQVGAFAAVTRDGLAALVDGELFVPEIWFDDPERCREAGMPEALEFRTKGEMALDMIDRLRREGLNFAYTAFDAGYGHLPWLLRKLDDGREVFLAEVHSDQTIYLNDPAPVVPQRQSARGKAPSRLQAQEAPLTVTAWVDAQPASRWRRMAVREGEKGVVVADYLTRRVWLWDGAEKLARCWHLLVRREIDGSKLKFYLFNTKPAASLRRLAEMQTARHFVERAFEDAKGACGMADYQVRGWQAWHHHMALVMVALMFLAKERLACRNTADLLSCNDLVEIMRHKLPRKIETDADLVMSIEERHRRRRKARDFAYAKQSVILSASKFDVI